MANQTGIVMELGNREVIVLASTGDFRRVKIRGSMPELGTEISLPLMKVKSNPWSKPFMSWVAAAAVMLMFISPWISKEITAPGQAVAYVTVDINPSIEMAVDEDQEVIAANPWNDDGRKILSRIKVKGLDADEAVGAITQEAVKAGYMGKYKENTVVVTVATLAKEIDASMEVNLQKSARKVLAEENLDGKVQTLQASEKVLQVAKAAGVSPGKLVILAELENIKNNSVSVEDLKTMSINQAIKTAGVDPGEVIDKAHKDTLELAGNIDLASKKFVAIDPGKTAEGGSNKAASGAAQEPKDDNPIASRKPEPDKSQVVTSSTVQEKPKDQGQQNTLTTPPTNDGNNNQAEPDKPGDDNSGDNGVPVIPKPPRVDGKVYDPVIKDTNNSQL